MPNGRAKYMAQEQLDQQILAEKQRQHQQALNAAQGMMIGAAAGMGSQGGRDGCCPSAQGEEQEEQESRLEAVQSQLDDLEGRQFLKLP
jgi:hypothetical protein